MLSAKIKALALPCTGLFNIQFGLKKRCLKPWVVQRGDLGYRPPPPGKSQVTIGFLENSGMDPSQGKSIWPSVKDIDNFNP